MKRKTQFHKLTVWLLSLAMLVTLMPGLTFSAFAADGEVASVTTADGTDTTYHTDINSAINAATAASGSTLKLMDSIVTTAQISIRSGNAVETLSSGNIYTLGETPEHTTYPLRVGGEQVTSANAADIFGDGTVSYDSATNTLTLNNYSYTGAGHEDAAIYYGGSDTLNLNLVGENTLTGSGVNVAGGLTVAGGTLKTDGTVSAAGDLIVKGSVIDANALNTSGSLSIDSDSHVKAAGGVVATTISFEEGFVATGEYEIFSAASGEEADASDGYCPTFFEYLGIDHLDCLPENQSDSMAMMYFHTFACPDTCPINGTYDFAEDKSMFHSFVSIDENNPAVEPVLSYGQACTYCGFTLYPIIIETMDGMMLVTDENAGDVLGDGTVSYDHTSNTLALNGANMVGGIVPLTDMTINIAGDSVVNGGFIAQDLYSPTLYDLTITGSAKLTVNAILDTDPETGEEIAIAPTVAAKTITLADDLAITATTPEGCDIISPEDGMMFIADADGNFATSVTIEPAPTVPTITGMTVKVNGVEQPTGDVAVSDGDEITIIYHGANLDLLPTIWTNSNYQLKLGSTTTWLTNTDSDYTVDAVSGTITATCSADKFNTNNDNNRTVGYKHKDDSTFTLPYTIRYQTAPTPVPKINGVKVLINGVEQPAGDLTIADSDEVTVIYSGENFETLGLNNQDYNYRIGKSTGNFYWFTIDTAVAPHTATRTYTGSSVKSGSIGYTNKGETEVIVYTINTQPPAPVTEYPLTVGGVQFTSNNLTIADGNGGTATYNPTTNTLTLNNYTCTDAGGYEVGVIVHSGSDTLYMVLIGTSTVSGNADETGIYSNGSIAISGTGSLTATGGDEAIYGVQLLNSNITISDSASLTAIGGASANNNSLGVSANDITVSDNASLTGIGRTVGGDCSEGVTVAFGSNITVSGNGSVTGIGSTATVQSAGLNVRGVVTISDNGSVTAKSDTANYSWGVSTSSVSVSGSGKLTAESGTATGAWDSESYGVCVWKGITVSDNGSLTATGGIADGDSATSYGVGTYGSGIITINGGTTIAQGNNGAFDVTPTIGETFGAKVWYGEDEEAANAAGEKPIGDLASNYSRKYVKVAEAEDNISGDFMTFVGAQIRITGTQGLRFIFSIPKSVYETLEHPASPSDTGLGFGSVVFPKKYLGDEKLVKDLETETDGKIATAKTVPAVKLFDVTDEYVYFTACLLDLSEDNYTVEYVAVPYVTFMHEGEEVTLYGEQTSNVTVFSVAKLAYADEKTSEQDKAYLYENILSVVDPENYPKA